MGHYDFTEISTILLFVMMSIPFWLLWAVFFLTHSQTMVNGNSNIPAGFQFGLYGVFIAEFLTNGSMSILVPVFAKTFVYGKKEWAEDSSKRLDFAFFMSWHLVQVRCRFATNSTLTSRLQAVLMLGPVGLISQGWNFNYGPVYV